MVFDGIRLRIPLFVCYNKTNLAIHTFIIDLFFLERASALQASFPLKKLSPKIKRIAIRIIYYRNFSS